MELASGRLPTWGERYADWLCELPSFQNQTNRAGMGRIRAIRGLRNTLTRMLPSFTPMEIETQLDSIVSLAKTKANANFWSA